jgi:hypothetical protein
MSWIVGRYSKYNKNDKIKKKQRTQKGLTRFCVQVYSLTLLFDDRKIQKKLQLFPFSNYKTFLIILLNTFSLYSVLISVAKGT